MLKSTLTTLDLTRNERDCSEKPDFTKSNSSKTHFLIPKAQIIFI